MAQPEFRPKSFGAFLDAVRTSSERVTAGDSGGTDSPAWIQALRAFGANNTINLPDLARAIGITGDEARSVAKDLLARDLVTVEGTALRITAKGRDTLDLIS
jgi:hypothetical protein